MKLFLWKIAIISITLEITNRSNLSPKNISDTHTIHFKFPRIHKKFSKNLLPYHYTQTNKYNYHRLNLSRVSSEKGVLEINGRNTLLKDSVIYQQEEDEVLNKISLKDVFIFIDTLQPVNVNGLAFSKNGEIEIVPKDYKNLLIYLVNNSEKPLFIGSTYSLSLIQEAQNKFGCWIPLEKKIDNFCGFGIMSVYIPPKHLAVSRAICYSGKYKAKLRIRLELRSSDFWNSTLEVISKYSPVFEGYIEESQMNYQWDSRLKKGFWQMCF